MGTFLSALLLAILAHAAYIHLQGPRLGSQQEVDPPPITCNILGHDDAVERFSKLLQFPTVGNQSEPEVHIPLDRRPHFHALLDYLPTAYRAVWSKCSIERVGAGDYTLLIKWEGSNSSLLPLLFISHYDVVPVTEGTDQDWLHGPFSGAVADGFIWGRGALDIKFTVAALLETINIFIEEGFVPERTIYVSFGHDEEVGGTLGAARVAKLLQQRGIEFEIIVDEGGTIFSDGLKPLTSSPVALVGTSEKVYTMVQVTLNSSGGHSSMPPVDGSDVATQMGKLLTYVQSHPFPSIMRPPFSDLLKTMASYTSNRVLQYLLSRCDTWPLQWLILRGCASSPTMAAQVRTTVAATKLWAGVAENVLPQQGHVLFNLRSHPHGTSEQQAVEYFREALRETGASGHAEVAAGSFHGAQRPAVTNSSGPHFAALKMAIRETWRHDGKGIGVVPMLMTGGTDSKHYAGLTRHGVLRFTPYTMNQTAGDLQRVHGTNERVPVHDFKRALCTYRRLIFLLSEGVMTPDEVL